MHAPTDGPAAIMRERHVPVTVPALERGRHVVTFVEPNGVPVGRRYALVSKAYAFPSVVAQDFHWFACFPADPALALGSPGVVAVVIESGCWEFDSDIAYVTYGVLAEGQPEPRLPPEVGEFCGVTFELRPREDVEQDGVSFTPERLELDGAGQEAYRLFYAAYSHIDGHEISFRAQQLIPQPSTALTYGEVHFLPTLRLLRLLGLRPADSFVDLGSGTGRLVLAASLICPRLRRCWGIELLPSLHAAAKRALAQVANSKIDHAPVELTCGDFLAADWSDATVAVAMSLCFPDPLLAALERQAMALRPGSRLVVMHCCLGDACPEAAACFRPMQVREQHPRHAVPTEMSYGETPLYLFERVAHGACGSAAHLALDELD